VAQPAKFFWGIFINFLKKCKNFGKMQKIWNKRQNFEDF